MLLFNIDNIEQTEIDLYIKYYYLDTGDIETLLRLLNNLYKEILDYSYPIYYSEKHQAAFRNFLELAHINTGESIRLRFKEGWRPEFRIKKKELQIEIPKKLGIPALILYLLLTGAQRTLDIRNAQLDNQLKQLDIQMKQMELYEKIEQKETLFERKPPYRQRKLDRQAKDILNFITVNDNFYHISINDMTIKDQEE